MNIREEIVERRRRRISVEGHELGTELPDRRKAPLLPFPLPPGIICEVKRRSPSRGEIDSSIDPFAHIKRYIAGGARSVSILTEEDHFGGSLSDLLEAKRRFPSISMLRKDFLVDEVDIEVSFRAGADAVLLIASMLDSGRLRSLYDRALSLGMTPLVEVHDRNDVDAVRPLRPVCVGCNARNLETFGVDLLDPLELREVIDWPCTTVFESGINRPEHVSLAVSGGYDAILVGESVVRDPGIVAGLVDALHLTRENASFSSSVSSFWSSIAGRRARRGSLPLVKICGLTLVEDVLKADLLGADLLGFVLADSPRRVEVDFLRELPQTRALRVVVVANRADERTLVRESPKPTVYNEPEMPTVYNEPEMSTKLPNAFSSVVSHELIELVESGVIDAVQFHGEESPEECSRAGVAYYKAVRLGSIADIDAMSSYCAPRVLIDAHTPRGRGGTGETVDPVLIEKVVRRGPLWLAGGLHPANVGEVVRRYRPELVDVSSGLESSPGVKDHDAMKRFMQEISSTARVSERERVE